MKKMNNKGFTLAELLIVVAIIAVLVAIAIPVFTTQLEKAREATDLANIRSAYGAAVSEYLGAVTPAPVSVTVHATQTIEKWQTNGGKPMYLSTEIKGSASGAAAFAEQVPLPDTVKAPGSYKVSITADGKVSVVAGAGA